MSNIEIQQQLRELENFFDREVFFIVGLPKSGTTWVQHILNYHENISCRGESHFFDILLPQLQRSFQHYNKEVLQQGGIVAHLKEYGGHVDSLNYKIDDTHIILLYCIYTMLNKWNDSDGNVLISGEKTPDSIHHLNLINSLLPRSKIIHVIRDGRDCATSGWFFNLSGMKKNKTVVQSFADYVSNFLKQWRSSIAMAQTIGETLGNRYCEVRYEALLSQPEQEISRLLQFLQVSVDEESIQHSIDSTRFEQMGDGHPQGQDINTAFIRKGTCGDWKNHFSPELAQHAWRIAGDVLKSLDYPER